MRSYVFLDEQGLKNRVEFTVICSAASDFAYGIRAEIFRGDGSYGKTEAEERFITEGEATAVIEYLCRYQVMPATLDEIL